MKKVYLILFAVSLCLTSFNSATASNYSIDELVQDSIPDETKKEKKAEEPKEEVKEEEIKEEVKEAKEKKETQKK